MGVMLFPSFVLGNASEEGSAPLALLYAFSFSLSLSPFFLFSSFLPLLFSFLPLLFSFLPFHFSFLPLFASFFCFPMIAPLSQAGDDVALRSRYVLRASLRFLPPQGLIVVHALLLDWTLLLLRRLGECRDCVVLRGGECYDLPRSVVSPVDAAFVW